MLMQCYIASYCALTRIISFFSSLSRPLPLSLSLPSLPYLFLSHLLIVLVQPESTTGTQFIVTTHILMSVFLLILAAIFLWIVNSIRDYILPKGSTKANQKNANSSSSGDVTAGTVGSHADAAVGGVSGYVPPQISMQSHSSPSTSSPSLGNDSILKGLYLSSSSPSNHNNNSSMGPSALVGGVGGVGGAEAGAVALSPPHAHTRQLRLSRDVDGYLRLNGRLALDVRLLSLSYVIRARCPIHRCLFVAVEISLTIPISLLSSLPPISTLLLHYALLQYSFLSGRLSLRCNNRDCHSHGIPCDGLAVHAQSDRDYHFDHYLLFHTDNISAGCN